MLGDTQQIERQGAIVRILRDGLVRRQEDLVRLLKTAGTRSRSPRSAATCATSAFSKAGGRYVLPSDEVSRANGDFGTLAQFVRGLKRAGPSSPWSGPPSARRRASPSPSTGRSGPKSPARSPATTPYSSQPPTPARRTTLVARLHTHLPSLRTMSNTVPMQGDQPIVLAYSGGLDTSFLVPWLEGELRPPRHHRHGRHRRHR